MKANEVGPKMFSIFPVREWDIRVNPDSKPFIVILTVGENTC